MDLDKIEDDILISNFVRETTKQRGSYIDTLMKKYVKNQDDSGLIDLNTLEVVKNKGHLNRIKCVPFSYLSRYSCKTGIKSLRILKRRIEIRKKYNVAEDGNEEESTKLSAIEKSSSILDCHVELTRIPSSYFINELPKRRKFSDQSSKKQILKRLSNLKYDFDLLSYNKSLHSPIRPSICDLSLNKFSGVHQNKPPISDNKLKTVKFWNNLDLIDKVKPQYVNKHKIGTRNTKFRKRDTQDICMEIEEIDITDDSDNIFKIRKTNISQAVYTSHQPKFKLNSLTFNKHTEVNERSKTVLCANLSVKNAAHCSEKSLSTFKLRSSNVNKHTEDNGNMNNIVPSANLSLKSAMHCSGKSSNFMLNSPLFKKHAEVNAQMKKTVAYDRLSLKSVPHCSEKSSSNFNLNSLIFNKHTEVNGQMNKTVTYDNLSLKTVSHCSERKPSNASSKRAIQTLPCSPVPNYPSNYNIKPVKFAVPTKSSEKNDGYKFSTVIPSSYSSPNYDFKLQSSLYITKS